VVAAPVAFFLVALCVAWIAVTDGPIGYLIWSLVCCAAAIGLVLRKLWAVYLALALCGLNIGAWFVLTISGLTPGWGAGLAAAPGLVWLLAWVMVAAILSRQLRRRP
jgi:hypothetical protein